MVEYPEESRRRTSNRPVVKKRLFLNVLIFIISLNVLISNFYNFNKRTNFNKRINSIIFELLTLVLYIKSTNLPKINPYF